MKREACVSLLRPVAYTIDYRGQHDDKFTFLFRGACWAQLVHTFAFLVGKGRGIAQDAFIYRCTDAVARNGKGSWYYAVELDEPNFHFSSLEDMKLLIESQLVNKQTCKVKYLNLDRFLNI